MVVGDSGTGIIIDDRVNQNAISRVNLAIFQGQYCVVASGPNHLLPCLNIAAGGVEYPDFLRRTVYIVIQPMELPTIA